MAKNKFWGVVCGLASLPVAVAGGLVEGTYNAVTGNGTFSEGLEKRSGTIVDGAVELGEEHGDKITGAIITAAAGWATKEGLEHSTHHPPHQS